MATGAFAERILRFMQAKGYRPQRIQELAQAMGIGEDEQGDFHAACKALMKTGRVVLGSSSALLLPQPPGTMIGVYRANPRGFGFVIPDSPDSHGDLYIPSGASGEAITGDTVRATVWKRGNRGGRMLHEGRIVKVLKRGQSRFVGELRREFARWFVLPDGNTLHVPIIVDDPGAKSARAGDQVVVEIVQYPSGPQEARGVIARVLGRRGEPGVDTLSAIEQYQLPGEFPEAVLEDARAAVAGYDAKREARNREDLSSITTITIDPTDARDFDDAISITNNDDGTTDLGVHIADVAFFVRAGGALDQEAIARSNSVYLPRMVIPMLPEVLSNGVCSLQEREPRLTKSAFITYDAQGQVRGARFANTIIRSAKRLTYEQASVILDGKTGRFSAKVVALLREADRLARTIRARRLREGMLVLDMPEVELVHDEAGAVIDVAPADRSFSHTIIEMFMVEANEAVARLLVEQDVPHLRRIHAASDQSDGSLRRFLKVLGHDLPADYDRWSLQTLLDEVRDRPESFAVNLAVLRSMEAAEYSPKRVGHYALASKDYCHFTSPIRRYPDLAIHRLIDQYLSGGLSQKGRAAGETRSGGARAGGPGPLPRPGRLASRGSGRGMESSEDRPVAGAIPTESELTTLGASCSASERRAEAAERELKLVLVLRLLEKHVGETFDGVVTGVANVGLFVQLTRFLIDGLIRFEGLLDDWWEVDPSRGAVVGQRSGRRIVVGDLLKVVVSAIHLPARRLDLMLAEDGGARKDSRTSRDSRTSKATSGAPRARRGSKAAARMDKPTTAHRGKTKTGSGGSRKKRTAGGRVDRAGGPSGGQTDGGKRRRRPRRGR